MSNSVHLVNDYICETYEGDQTSESVTQIIEQTLPFIAAFRKKSKPVYLLVHLEQIGNMDMGSRRAAFLGLEKMDIDKLALVGISTFLKHIATLILYSSKKADKVRFFNTEEEAKQWFALQ